MLSLVVPSLLLAVLGSPVDGTWTGTLPTPGKPLHLVFHLTKSGGTIDSPDQNANGIPISALTAAGASVRVTVGSIGGTYSGKLTKSGNELTGEWKQGAALPLTIKRAGGSAASAEGKWEGAMQTPQGRLRIIFNVKKSGAGYTGTTDSPDQNAYGIALSSVTLKGGILRISSSAIKGEFSGKLSADSKSASGELWQGVSYPLTLKRSR